jgi:hypothetical protein
MRAEQDLGGLGSKSAVRLQKVFVPMVRLPRCGIRSAPPASGLGREKGYRPFSFSSFSDRKRRKKIQGEEQHDLEIFCFQGIYAGPPPEFREGKKDYP